MKDHQSVLIIGFVWPEPDSSAAGSRMMQLIGLFQKQNWAITFASTASDSDYMTDLNLSGITKKNITLNSSDFDEYIAGLNPSIVIFDRFMTEEQFGWRVAQYCPGALRILDTEDLQCLRRSRQNAFRKSSNFEPEDLLADEVSKREVASILRCDLSLIISEYEIDLLERIFKVDPLLLHYLPLLTDGIDKKNIPGFEERQHFVFIGNFLHEPNVDAVKFLKSDIWPIIRKILPLAELHIYGAYPSHHILQLHNAKERFLIRGRAQHADEVVKAARIVLAPIRFGAGIKGKLLEAMQCGTPSVTTSIGAEAMHGDLPWNGFVCDDPQAFADAAVRLYNDPMLWNEMQRNGFVIINKRYLTSLFGDDFIGRILSVKNNLQRHRKYNFIGAMLQFHTVRSTEYLSRWIEEKNKQP